MASAGGSTVTAGEAARRLGVAPATIQRWANQGLLRVERTAGGHRRVPLTELRRLVASSGTTPPGEPLAGWLRAFLSSDPAMIWSELVRARQLVFTWATIADEVASAISELGRQWEAGSCRVFEEHMASEALRRAVARCAGDMWRPGDGPCAALFTVHGERHTLGLSLAELVLAENGWKVLWIGEGPPAEELELIVEKYSPELLIVSASPACKPLSISSYQRALVRMASRGTKLVLAGNGCWTVKRPARRIVTFSELHALLARLKKKAV